MADIADGVKETVAADTTTTETPTADNNISTDSLEDDELVFDLDELDEEQTEKTSADESSKPQESDDKSTRANKRNEQLNYEIRDKVRERNALRDEIAALQAQKANLQPVAELPTINELMNQRNPATGDYYSRAEAENAILKQRLDAIEGRRAIEDYAERVADSITQMSGEADRVVKDFPIFDPDSNQYNASLTKEADDIMKGLLVYDADGQPVGTRVPLYQVYSTIAKAAASGEITGKSAGRKAALDMMNNADVGSSAKAPASAEDDDFLAGLLG